MTNTFDLTAMDARAGEYLRTLRSQAAAERVARRSRRTSWLEPLVRPFATRGASSANAALAAR